jgi:hypothetical protein
MSSNRIRLPLILPAVAFTLLLGAGAGQAMPVQQAPPAAIEIAQAQGTEPRELEPRYKPVPPEEKGWYNGSYIFGLTRGVAGSTIEPAFKAPLFLFTVPLDIALLPFAAIGGLFG